jgi:hypothetical protein
MWIFYQTLYIPPYKVYIMPMEGLTITEMSEKSGLKPRTVERRIQRAGIKPLTKEATYPKDTLKRIKDVKMGRPKKPHL